MGVRGPQWSAWLRVQITAGLKSPIFLASTILGPHLGSEVADLAALYSLLLNTTRLRLFLGRAKGKRKEPHLQRGLYVPRTRLGTF